MSSIHRKNRPGGWCSSLDNCYSRALGSLGSSSSYPVVPANTLPPGVSYEGVQLFSAPPFDAFSVAYAKYCTGESWLSRNATPTPYQNLTLYFQGAAMLDALVDSLGARGLVAAPEVVVAGCSAGALTAYLHVDYIASRLPPTTLVLGLGDAMFALNHSAFPGPSNVTYMNYMMAWVYSLNVTASVNPACVEWAGGGAAGYRCLWGANLLPFIAAPTLVVNSKYDTWQEVSVLGFNSTQCPGTFDPVNGSITLCLPEYPAQEAYWMAYGDTLADAVVAMPARHGAFITNCPTHCETGIGWNYPSNASVPGVNTTLGAVVGLWHEEALAHAREPDWAAPRFVAKDGDLCVVPHQ